MEEVQPPRRISARRIANERRRQEQIAQRLAQQEQHQNAPEQIQQVMDEEEKVPELEEEKEMKQPPKQGNKSDKNQRNHNPMFAQKVSPSRFLAKIPNIRVLRDFLVNKGGYYCPPQQYLNNSFCRELLAGSKKLLKSKDVIWVSDVPRWPEFAAKVLWQKVQSNKGLAIYFPDYTNSKLPQRKYLLNVANTVAANSVIKAVLEVRQQRQKQKISQQPIMVTNEFAQLLNQFTSISIDQKRKGLNLKQPKQVEQCPLCLQPLNRVSSVANFHCLRHKAHRRCVKKYLLSDNDVRRCEEELKIQ